MNTNNEIMNIIQHEKLSNYSFHTLEGQIPCHMLHTAQTVISAPLNEFFIRCCSCMQISVSNANLLFSQMNFAFNLSS